MATAQDQENRARALWLTCLASAFRTSLACTIVAIATLYGPPSLRQQVAFPAFSYVTVILIAPDATLGDTFRGFWLALYATIQSVGPAMLSLWLIGPAQLTSSTTALAVALAAFVVVLPGEATHLVAKRIALGQIVIVYVIAFINGRSTHPILHPVHVVASTAVGVLACILALLVPFPRLACREVKHNSKMLVENASERLKLFVKAFCAEDRVSALASISQAKSLASVASKFFQTIKRHQDSMQWERLPHNCFIRKNGNSGDRLQSLQTPLRGMELALSSTPSFPIEAVDAEVKSGLLKLVEEMNNMNSNKRMPSEKSVTVPESNAENVRCLQTLQTTPQSHQDLPTFFFLFCMNHLHVKLSATSSVVQEKLPQHQNEGPITSSKRSGMWSNLSTKVSSKRVIEALKCSLSLGLAVFFGLKFSKENGFWSGLPVAISFASGRQTTFTVANFKAQGTVLGTVYGVFGCFLFQKYLPVRLFSLIPWFIFTSFLQRSKMYGQAGGISAVIGAVLILGRTNFGDPSDFAIARITETFIGLSCSIIVELLFQPTRASTLAKIHLSRTLETLHRSINSLSLQSGRAQLEDNQKSLKVCVRELTKLIGEANAEPNFWYMPFHSASYGKLLSSTSKMMDLLVYSAHAIGLLEQNSQGLEGSWKGILHTMECDLELFKTKVGSLISCLKEITLIKSLTVLEKEGLDDDQETGKSCDLELGKVGVWGLGEEDIDTIVSSYLLHSKEVVDKIQCQELKGQMVLCLSALGFCISGLIRGTKEIEEGIKELVQGENPSSHINLYEIYRKMQAVQK